MTDTLPKALPRNLANSGASENSLIANSLTCLPNAPNQSLIRTNRMEPQKGLKGDGIGSGLL